MKRDCEPASGLKYPEYAVAKPLHSDRLSGLSKRKPQTYNALSRSNEMKAMGRVKIEEVAIKRETCARGHRDGSVLNNAQGDPVLYKLPAIR